MRSEWAALLLVVFTAACQGHQPAKVQARPVPADLAAEARDAIARRDWNAAAPLLRHAISSAPDEAALHYDLAICATYLDLRDEAAREFRWVLDHVAAGSEEATVASNWLAQAAAPAVSAAVRSEPVASDPALSGSVRGTVGWAEPGQGVQPLNRKLIHLVGLKNTPTSGLRYNIRSDEDGRFKFEHVAPGPYKLTDVIAGEPMWRLRITVPETQEATVDLGPGNSAKVRDDFPEPPPS